MRGFKCEEYGDQQISVSQLDESSNNMQQNSQFDTPQKSLSQQPLDEAACTDPKLEVTARTTLFQTLLPSEVNTLIDQLKNPNQTSRRSSGAMSEIKPGKVGTKKFSGTNYKKNSLMTSQYPKLSKLTNKTLVSHLNTDSKIASKSAEQAAKVNGIRQKY